VWTQTERHLFADARGRRHSMPRVGRWHDFTRLPGRARSHTTANKWETFRLCGTLAGHRAAYTDRTGDFVQPRHLRPVYSDAWWSYDGPLACVHRSCRRRHSSSLAAADRAVEPASILAPPRRSEPVAQVDLVRRRDPRHRAAGATKRIC
jgi:hypothetical protein